MNSVQTRIDALAGRADWLRKLGSPLFLLGCGLIILSLVVVWPEPGEPGTLSSARLFVPNELAGHITGAGQVLTRPIALVEPMSQTSRIQFGLLPLVLWLFWKGAALIFKSWTWRGAVLFFGWPFAFWIISALTESPGTVRTITPGQLTGNVKYFGPDDSLRDARTLPLRLDESRLGRLETDQAKFLFAQQAYQDEQPDKVGAHLRSLTGAWRPNDDLSRTIIGVLAGYAGAHGHDAGKIAPQLADGRPHYAIRLAITAWSMRIGTILVIVGLLLDLTGFRRARAARRFRTAVAAPA